MNGRLLLVAAAFVVAFGAVGLRLVELGFAPGPATRGVHASSVVERGDLVDRHGRLLATTVPAPRVVADPRRVRDPIAEAFALAEVLGDVDAAALSARLASGRHHVVVDRDASLVEAEAVRRLGLPGVRIENRRARVYPNGRLAAHAIGYVDVDSRGLSGAERAFDAELRAGESVRLAMDLAIQAALTEELRAAVDRFRAVAAAGLVLDTRTGELLALASLPDFDPHHPMASPADARKDRNVTQTFELGSVFKLFTVAMGLETGTVRLQDRFDVSKPLRISGFAIDDFQPEADIVSVAETLIHSSNIASAKIALKAGSEAQAAFLQAFHLDRPLRIETGTSARPQLPQRRPDVSVATIAFGHGIAVTPLHVATGVAGVLGPGHAITPTLRHRDTVARGEPAIGMDVVRRMRGLTYRVATEGSGQQALVDGYLLGGKTGTAEKVGANGRYADGRVRSSFVAALPIDEPEIVVFVMLDEPDGPPEHRHLRFGSWTAAPTVGRIVARIGPLLGLEAGTADAIRDLRRWGGADATTAVHTRPGGADAAAPARG